MRDHNTPPIQHIIKSFCDNRGDYDQVIWWDWYLGVWKTERVGNLKTLLMSALVNIFN